MHFFERPEYPRNEEMFYCRQLGMTLQAIAERYGISAPRVRQNLMQRDRNVEEWQRSTTKEAGAARETEYYLTEMPFKTWQHPRRMHLRIAGLMLSQVKFEADTKEAEEWFGPLME